MSMSSIRKRKVQQVRVFGKKKSQSIIRLTAIINDAILVYIPFLVSTLDSTRLLFFGKDYNADNRGLKLTMD